MSNHQQNNQQLNEGLRPMDLVEMVYPTFEVDTYRSKMGEDKDVCVVSFQVKERAPAKDLMEFVEKGYSFVLDADVSAGENSEGEYAVFIELSRTPRLAEQIKELTYGIRKLTGIDDFQFKYYKDHRVHECTEETLKSIIPGSNSDYIKFMEGMRTESVKSFFTKTLMDDLSLENDVITIHKPFNKEVKLRMVKDDAAQSILEGSEDKFSVDEEATSEMFWLTKVLGDYNINKVGDNFLFTNGDRAMLLQRIE